MYILDFIPRPPRFFDLCIIFVYFEHFHFSGHGFFQPVFRTLPCRHGCPRHVRREADTFCICSGYRSAFLPLSVSHSISSIANPRGGCACDKNLKIVKKHTALTHIGSHIVAFAGQTTTVEITYDFPTTK